MPALSPTMKEGKLARWLRKPGEAIAAGDVVAEIETDKATMEVEAVRAAAAEAVAHCRAGKGPVLMEVDTYRYRGHSMSDPAKYRQRSEVDEIRKNHDPIDHVRRELLERGVAESDLKAMDDKVRAVVVDAAEFAQTSPEPDPSELWTDILVGS